MNLPPPTVLLYVLLAVSAILIAIVGLRPAVTASREGKILAFLAFCVLPIVCGAFGVLLQFERSKQTQFCLSCHIMEPYGKSLYADDPNFLAAAHFQNHRVPADQACYTCHTDYALYGGLRTKLHGLRHVWAQYFGTPMRPIRLYRPYNNRECLHCHAGARSFETPTHLAMLDLLRKNEMSCLSSGCHDVVHNVGNLDRVKFWRPEE